MGRVWTDFFSQFLIGPWVLRSNEFDSEKHGYLHLNFRYEEERALGQAMSDVASTSSSSPSFHAFSVASSRMRLSEEMRTNRLGHLPSWQRQAHWAAT